MNSRRRHVVWAFVISLAVTSIQIQSATAQSWKSNGPLPRANHSAVFDATTGQMIVFGGNLSAAANTTSNQNFNDVWRQSGSLTWTAVSPTGTPPTPRTGHSAVYDPASNRMMVFGGGLGNASPCANDVWVLKDANGTGGTPSWKQLSPTGGPPAARLRHTAVYDATNNRMIVFGGNDCSSTNFGDVWVLSDANGQGGTLNWTQLSPSGTSPGASEDHTAVYDSSSNSMIVFAGSLGGPNSNEVWVLSNANGLGGTPTWTQLTPSGGPPAGRQEPSAIYDEVNNVMTIYGGNDASGVFGDVWILSNANGLAGSPVWTQLGPFTVFSEARTAHTAVYNATANKMIVFGGLTAPGNAAATNDVWALKNANGK